MINGKEFLIVREKLVGSSRSISSQSAFNSVIYLELLDRN